MHNSKQKINLKTRTLKAYTLLELLVITGVFVVVAGLVFPISLNQVQGNEVKSAASNLSSLIFSIQQDAYSRKDNTSYGVVFEAHQLIIYTGENYLARTSDESIEITQDITISSINLANNGNEVHFPVGEFRPGNYGTIRLSQGNSSYDIVINSQGLIYYQKV